MKDYVLQGDGTTISRDHVYAVLVNGTLLDLKRTSDGCAVTQLNCTKEIFEKLNNMQKCLGYDGDVALDKINVLVSDQGSAQVLFNKLIIQEIKKTKGDAEVVQIFCGAHLGAIAAGVLTEEKDILGVDVGIVSYFN
jgi:hypothetical protein